MYFEGKDMTGQQDAVTMGAILVLAPESDVLNGDVKSRLNDVWSEIPAASIATAGIFGLAKDLLIVLPDDRGYGNELRLKVAEEIIALLKRFGISGEPTPHHASPTTIRIERNYSEMSLRQLLETIIADPDVYLEAKRYIHSHPELSVAVSKTYQWVVLNENGGIDLEATMTYVTELNKSHSVPQRKVGRNRSRPISLDRAMGVNDQPLIHPFTGSLVQGPDKNGFDWALLNEELHESLIWARRTQHPSLPDFTADLYGWSEDVFRNPLPRRWQIILDDYRNAKRDRVSTTDGIRCFWPEDLPHTDVYTFGIVVKKDYETLVREAAALAAPLRQSGMNARIQGGVYSTIHISGMAARANDVVVVNGGTINGMDASGTIYTPPGVGVRISGMNSNVQVVNMTWKQLAEKLGLV